MNKRQRKKFKKKNMYKTYYGYRYSKLLKIAEKHFSGNNDILYIVDSRRGKLKYIHEVKLLCSVTPGVVSNMITDNELDISFSCHREGTEKLKEMSAASELMKSWLHYIIDNDLL